jgi:IS5 family transposase
MNSINDQLTIYYFLVAEFFRTHPSAEHWRRSNHQPRFTDAEVLTIGLMQGYFGCATLKRAYLLVRANHAGAFPRLCSYQQWLARLHRLSGQMGQMALGLPVPLAAAEDFYLVDAQPLPLCHPLRHGRVINLREDGAYFGKTSKGWFFGFKLHVLTTPQGHLLAALVTPGNWPDQAALRDLLESVPEGSICLGDWAYRGQRLQEDWYAEGILILTKADAPRERQALLSTVRQRVETTFSQLWSRFMTRLYARSWAGLFSSTQLKMLGFALSHAGCI